MVNKNIENRLSFTIILIADAIMRHYFHVKENKTCKSDFLYNHSLGGIIFYFSIAKFSQNNVSERLD